MNHLQDDWTASVYGTTGRRLRFIINPEGDVLLVDMLGWPINKQDTADNTWIHLPVISAAAAAGILEDQLWSEPFGREDVAKLLDISCTAQDMVAPSLLEQGLCQPSEVSQLITFKNRRQAAERAALLAAFTYSSVHRAACKLQTVQESPLGAVYRKHAALLVAAPWLQALQLRSELPQGTSLSAHLHVVQLGQAAALRQKLAEAANSAAAAAGGDLLAKQQAVSAARVAAAAASMGLRPVLAVPQQLMMSAVDGRQTEGTCRAAGADPATAVSTDDDLMALPAAPAAGQVVMVAAPNRSLNTSNVGAASLTRPVSMSAAAAQARLIRQQEQAAAQQVAGQVRDQVQCGRQEVLSRRAAASSSAQRAAQQDMQDTRDKLEQQQTSRQAAAVARADLLRAVRSSPGSRKAVSRRQQQLATSFSQQCNMLSKHLKRGEVAVLRAAGAQQVAQDLAGQQQQRGMATLQAALLRQQQADTTAEVAAVHRCEARQMQEAAQQVAALQQAAKRATVAAQLLWEGQLALTVGPAGGCCGSGSAGQVALREPLQVALVGDVSSSVTAVPAAPEDA
eukprot:gene12689-12820_t